jgi:hypothetical protein
MNTETVEMQIARKVEALEDEAGGNAVAQQLVTDMKVQAAIIIGHSGAPDEMDVMDAVSVLREKSDSLSSFLYPVARPIFELCSDSIGGHVGGAVETNS